MNEHYSTSFLTKNMEFFDVEDIYRLRPDRRWPWLQALLFWVLRKLGAYEQKQVSTYSVVDLNLQSFGNFLQAFAQETYRRTGDPPKRVLVGWRTFRQFITSGEINDFMCHPQKIDLPTHGRYDKYERGQYRGFSLLTLPWFAEGVIFLPNDL